MILLKSDNEWFFEKKLIRKYISFLKNKKNNIFWDIYCFLVYMFINWIKKVKILKNNTKVIWCVSYIYKYIN